MTVVVLPDIEQLVSEFLRAQAEVTALVGQRVYTAVPNEPTFPLLLLKRIAGSPVLSRPRVIDAPVVQLDAYGGTKKQAHTLIQTACAVVAERIEGVHATGVVAGVVFGPLSWLPDPSYVPAKARFVADITFTVRP